MGRGRHTPSRGRGSGSDPHWDEHGGWDEECGTEEWLNGGDAARGWQEEPRIEQAPEDGSEASEARRSAAPDSEPPPPRWPRAWEQPPAITGDSTGTAWPTPAAAGSPGAWDHLSAVNEPSAWERASRADGLPAADDPAGGRDRPPAVGDTSGTSGTAGWPDSGGFPDSGRVPGTGGFTDPAGRPGVDVPPGRDGPGSGPASGTRNRRAREAAEPKRGRGRRLVVISTLAVVVAAGATTIGLRLSSSELNLTRAPECPQGRSCAAQGGSPDGAPPPSAADAGTGTTPAPPQTDSPSPTATASPKPSGTRTTERRSPEATARPTPERTRPTPTPKPSRTITNTPEPLPVPSEIETPLPEDTHRQSDPAISPGRVAVDFGVAGLSDTGYTGLLTITNTGRALDEWTLRVPVGGTVTEADGVIWEQDGDTLVLTSADPLGANERTVIWFSAEGDSVLPDNCRLAEGRCRVGTGEAAAFPPASGR